MGLRGGTASEARAGGVTHPFRTAQPAGIGKHRTAARARWYDLSHHRIAVGDEHCLASRGKADIFAELVLEDLQADRAHANCVATGSYFVKAKPRS